MNQRTLLLAACMCAAQYAPAQNGNVSQWVGVWEGQLNDRPGMTVTLGNDAGDLQGTIVFNFFGPEGSGEAHVIGHDAHVLTHMEVHDSTLSFQAKQGDSRELHFSMKLTADGKAVLNCADCGEAPSIELNRIP